MNGALKVSARLTGDALEIPSREETRVSLRTELLRDWAGVSALAPEWNGLLRQSHADTPYLTWQWMQAWMGVVGRRHEPFVVAVRDAAGALCGLAPFYVARYSLLGALAYRMLRVMGDQPTGAEYGDWVVRRDCEAGAARAIARELAWRSGSWDGIWMQQLSGWTGAHARITTACDEAGLLWNSRPITFGSIELPATIEAYEAALTDNRRKQFRSQRNKILVKGGATVARCESRRDLPEYLAALFDLHGKRRQALGEPGSFLSRPDETHFYKEFVPRALDEGWLWLSALRQDGVIRAVQLGYVYDEVFHQLQEGFDPEFTAGAGNVLRYEVIRQCIAQGIREYDFLGGYTDHKRRWLAEPRDGHDLFIGRPGLLNRALFSGPVWPTGRYLRPHA